MFALFGALEIFLSSNLGISGDHVKKSLISDHSGMVGVFAEKSFCLLIVGRACGGKTRFVEGVVGLRKLSVMVDIVAIDLVLNLVEKMVLVEVMVVD